MKTATENYSESDNQFNILLFDVVFTESNIAKSMILKGKWTVKFHHIWQHWLIKTDAELVLCSMKGSRDFSSNIKSV